MFEFSKICLHQNSIFENFENPQCFFTMYTKKTCSQWKMGAKPSFEIINEREEKKKKYENVKECKGVFIKKVTFVILNA